ncbi:hypothetical protein JB92DRAFT_2825618 [Gautieria morchelliformis]|nr:hypothetical protein JB92DRAFT_2825618 [Gautieria morchelliformis]
MKVLGLDDEVGDTRGGMVSTLTAEGLPSVNMDGVADEVEEEEQGRKSKLLLINAEPPGPLLSMGFSSCEPRSTRHVLLELDDVCLDAGQLHVTVPRDATNDRLLHGDKDSGESKHFM